MTVTVKPGRVAVVVAVALGVLTAYLIGSSRTASAVPPASTTLASVQAAGSSTSTSTGITVSGTGTVSGTPDTLIASLSVTATNGSVSTAFGNANGAMAAVQRALRGKGVAAADLQTTNVSVQQAYTSNGRPDGYSVVESLNVTVHDVAKASDDIAAAVAAGRNLVRIDGVSLDLEDTSPLVSKARDAAFAQAKAKAEQYAQSAGRSLGQVVSIQEVTAPVEPRPYLAGGYPAAFTDSLKAPIQAGSQDVAVQVTVTFALG